MIDSFTELNPIIAGLLTQGQVYLSYPTNCTNCNGFVRLIGEHRINGNWYCPLCTAYWPYKTLNEPIPWEKRAWKVQSPAEVIIERSPMSQFYANSQQYEGLLSGERPKAAGFSSGLLFGLVSANFPQNLSTGFLVPSFGYKIKRRRSYLLAKAEDGTRTGRVKGPLSWGFDLVYKNRSKEELDTLISFWDTMGFAGGFNYRDAIRLSDHICYFDSDVEAEASSFNTLDFSVTIVE